MTAVEKKLPTPLARGRRNFETSRFGACAGSGWANPRSSRRDVMECVRRAVDGRQEGGDARRNGQDEAKFELWHDPS